jgi:hypothetical protein
MKDQEEMMAMLANDLFNKRERFIAASRLDLHLYDNRSAQALEEEFRIAEAEYNEAKAVFARAMKPDPRAA